ncbi:MAG: hypothetical protein JW812_03190 [Alphaproteobacteria bacterium]|nr:hypothetical protein [Alphaproteobacteria bacterium]MBN2779849.1 hypothetical protein [Alphaproteobacteria bacterium]
MNTKLKLGLAALLILILGYTGFYYSVTHGFDVKMAFQLREKNKKNSTEEILKILNSGAAGAKECLALGINDIFEKCREKVGFPSNPYKRQDALKTCAMYESLIYLAEESKTGFKNCAKQEKTNDQTK